MVGWASSIASYSNNLVISLPFSWYHMFASALFSAECMFNLVPFTSRSTAMLQKKAFASGT